MRGERKRKKEKGKKKKEKRKKRILSRNENNYEVRPHGCK
jgi:hypothetical protein